MKGLTEKQRQIYQFIVSFQQDHGYPPSVREIGEHMGLKSPSTVHFHLKGLEEAGIITKAEGKPRTAAGRRSPPKTRSPWWATWPPAPPSWPRRTSRTI